MCLQVWQGKKVIGQERLVKDETEERFLSDPDASRSSDDFPPCSTLIRHHSRHAWSTACAVLLIYCCVLIAVSKRNLLRTQYLCIYPILVVSCSSLRYPAMLEPRDAVIQ